MLRKPLGRGLGALIDSTGPEENESTPLCVSVAVDQISASPFQPRKTFDSDRLQELANAIRSQGVIEPLVVRRVPSAGAGDRYELIAGGRRLLADRECGLMG